MSGRARSRGIAVWTRSGGRRSRCIVPRLISATISNAIGGRSVGCSWRFGRYHGAVAKYSGLRCRCDRWLAHVYGGPLLGIGSRRLRMLSLNRDWGDMSLVRRSFLLRRWTRVDPAIAAVVADMGFVVNDYGLVVHV